MTILTAVESQGPATKGEKKKRRAAGQVPAIVYGKGMEQKLVYLPAREFNRFLNRSDSRTVQIRIGDGEPLSVNIRDVQRHPVTEELLHADLLLEA